MEQRPFLAAAPDYLQTYSNIHRGGYYLEEPINGSAAKELIKKGSIVFSILMLCVDIIYGYFAYVKWVPNHWALYVTLALCNIIPMWRGISSLVKYKKQIQQEQVTSMEAKKQKREALNVEDLADEIPFEQLFEQEFSVVIKTKKEEKVTEERREEKKRVIGTQFDKEFLLPQIAKEFSIYVYERGIKVDAQSVKKLFASLAASRLVIMKNSNVELTEKFLNLMNEYLGAASSLQTYASVAENGLFCSLQCIQFRTFHIHFDKGSILAFQNIINGTDRNGNSVFCAGCDRRTFTAFRIKLQSSGSLIDPGTDGRNPFACSALF